MGFAMKLVQNIHQLQNQKVVQIKSYENKNILLLFQPLSYCFVFKDAATFVRLSMIQFVGQMEKHTAIYVL